MDVTDLLIVLRRGAQDGQLRPAGFGFGRLTRVKEGLQERLEMLSFLRSEEAQRGYGLYLNMIVYDFHKHFMTFTQTQGRFCVFSQSPLKLR